MIWCCRGKILMSFSPQPPKINAIWYSAPPLLLTKSSDCIHLCKGNIQFSRKQEHALTPMLPPMINLVYRGTRRICVHTNGIVTQAAVAKLSWSWLAWVGVFRWRVKGRGEFFCGIFYHKAAHHLSSLLVGRDLSKNPQRNSSLYLPPTCPLPFI